MSEKIVNGEYHQWFESFEEMEAALPKMVERQPRNVDILRANIAKAVVRPKDWLGHREGYAGHFERIRKGWPEYAETVREASKAIEAALDLSTVTAMTTDVRRRKRMRRDSGDTLHMTRVWNGDLDHAWDRPERVPRRAPSQRYATVFIDLCASAFQDAADGVWRAATTMKINDLFTSAGIATEVWVGDSSYATFPENNRVNNNWRAVRAKEFMQPMNDDRLAALSSVGTLRTMSFTMIAASPFKISTGFGCPYNRGLPWPLRERQEKGERVIRIGECWNVNDAKREIAAVAAAMSNKEVAA